VNPQPRGKAQSYSLDDVITQWKILKHFHKRLVEISGVEENSQLDDFLDYLNDVLKKDSCPPEFYRNLTTSKAESVRKVWDTLLLKVKAKSSDSNYQYLLKKLRSMESIDEVIEYSRKDFSDSEIAVEKNLKGRFKNPG
jgi:hypothetical protein